MKFVIVTLALLMIVFSMLTADASQDKRHNNNALRERLFNSFMQLKREGLLYNNHERRRQHIAFNNENDADERTLVRRKGIGLHDDPFK